MTHKDPKTHITEEAFRIPSFLLGTPLATPRRRLLALLIDLMLIAVLAKLPGAYIVLTISFFLLIGAFIKKRKGRFKKVFRIVFSILLVIVIIITAAAIWGNYYLHHVIEPMTEGKFQSKADSIKYSALMEQVKKGIATDSTASEKLKEALHTEEMGKAPEAVQKLLKSITPKTYNAWDSITPEHIVIMKQFAQAYASRDSNKLKKLEPTVRMLVAGREIDYMQKQIDSLQRKNLASLAQIAEYKNQIDNPSVEYLLKGLINDLGLTFGLAGFYFIIVLMWFNGSTLGKAICGIQVIRLNGEPIGLWNSFERYGGYAAGLATGLMGFLQIYWDPNRQAIHDKIAGTAVILKRGTIRNHDS